MTINSIQRHRKAQQNKNLKTNIHHRLTSLRLQAISGNSCNKMFIYILFNVILQQQLTEDVIKAECKVNLFITH
jgi:hypothetical protein